MRRPLLPAPTVAVALLAISWAAFLAMAIWLHDSRDPTAVDASVSGWLYAHTGSVVQAATLGLTDPLLTVGGCAAVAVCALLVGRWSLAILASIGPLAGLLLESHVFKPAIDRRFGFVETQSRGIAHAGYGYPSGHETGLTTLTTLLVIVLLGSHVRRGLKIALLVVAVLWTALGAVGLVRNGFHYLTDTFGGVALGIGLMLTLALLLDAVTRRLSSPAGRGRARTARAA